MSAITIDLLDYLRKRGMDEESIRRITQSFDQRVEDALREAKAHADRHRAESDENAKVREAEITAKFVSVDKYHERDRTLATRDDINAALAGVRTEIAESRKDNRHTQRILMAVIAALIALIVKAYFPV